MQLPRNLFPPINLSPEQCASYEKLTEGVIKQALREYDDFNVTRSRQLDRKRWKKIKKSDDITVFCERSSYIAKRSGSAPSSGSMSSDSPASQASKYKNTFTSSRAGDNTSEFNFSETEDDFRDASMIYSPVSKISTAAVSSISETEVLSTSKRDRAALPKILAVGRVPGKMEDIIYSILTPTETVSRFKEAYVADEIADCRILYEIKGATPDEPLRFLGLKWILKSHSPLIGSLVRQRDVVFVESLGVRAREDGSRFGYFVMHSVEVPDCGELSQYSIVRCQVSIVYIVTQSTHGQADVFMKSYVEANGNIPDSIGVRTAANSLITVSATTMCAHKRKMGWAATKKLRSPTRPAPPLLSSDSHCSNCKKRFSRISTASVCYFCSTRTCSKCCEQRDIFVSNPNAKTSPTAKLITKMAVITCTRCYSTVFRDQSAEDVAREEVLAGEYGSVPKDYVKAPVKQKSSSSTPYRRSLDIGDLQHLTISRQHSAREAPAPPTHAASSSIDLQRRESVIELDRSDFVRVPGTSYQGASSHSVAYDGQGYYEPPPPYMAYPSYSGAPLPPHLAYAAGQQQPPLSYGIPPSQSSGDDLYTRIAKLNQTAEQVYQYTKRTANSSLGSNSAPMTRS